VAHEICVRKDRHTDIHTCLSQYCAPLSRARKTNYSKAPFATEDIGPTSELRVV